MRVAVIGGGAAGLAAAQVLCDDGVDVLVFDAQELGGSCLGFEVGDADGVLHRVDVGVSHFSPSAFPELASLVEALELDHRPVDADTSAMFPDGTLAWNTRGDELQLGSPVADAQTFLEDVARFREVAHEVLESPELSAMRAAQYLARKGYGADFERLYFGARARAILASPGDDPLQLSMGAAVATWQAQGLVGLQPAARHVVEGGMHRYVAAWLRRLEAQGVQLLALTRVVGLNRERTHVDVRAVDALGRHGSTRVDAVLLALPPQEALPLLEQASRDEQLALLGVPSRRLHLVVHSDSRLLPRARARWGTFNLVVPVPERPSPPSSTIWANRLARLPPGVPDVFVTVNPVVDPQPGTVRLERFLTHPVDEPLAAEGRAALAALQGAGRTYHVAAALGPPWLHETALGAGQATARQLLADLRKPAARRNRPTITQEAIAPPWVAGAGLFILAKDGLGVRGVAVVTEQTVEGITLRCPAGVQVPASEPLRLGVVRGSMRKLTVFQSAWLGGRREGTHQLVRVGTPTEAVTPPRARARYEPHRWRATARIGSEALKGMVVDISATGLALDCTRPPSARALLGRRGTVTLRAEDATHRLEFVIARQLDTPGGVRLGLAFVDEDGPALARLELSLVRVAAKAAPASRLPMAAGLERPGGVDPVTVRNVSVGGLIVSAASLPPKLTVRLALPTQLEPLHLEATPKRARRGGGAAVDFFGVDARARAALADFVAVVERLAH